MVNIERQGMFILRKEDSAAEMTFKRIQQAHIYGKKNISKGIRFSVKHAETEELLHGVGGTGLIPAPPLF